MSDPDRLAELRERVEGPDRLPLPPWDAAWLIGEVERLREVEADWERVCEELRNAKVAIANLSDRLNLKIDELRTAEAGQLRLRDLIGRLEWGCRNAGQPCCPACWGIQPKHHRACKLAAELGAPPEESL